MQNNVVDELPDLTGCDREPIHIPGTIQPHGVLLVAACVNLIVRHGAGDVARVLNVPKWMDRPLTDLIGGPLTEQAVSVAKASAAGGFAGVMQANLPTALDVSAHISGEYLLIECEPNNALPRAPSVILGALEAAGAAFERAPSLKSLCDVAAVAFRQLTGYDRVIIYRFLDDAAGVVLAEDRSPGLRSFMHHHFPASDIPQQARALYVRNLVRVIPDVTYEAAPLQPDWNAVPLDMSDCILRSVSPIHLQYLQNMDVRASASISIIKDGALWGLVACHNGQPLAIPYDARAACRALVGTLARQIKAKEESESYRERLRLRGTEDDIVSLLAREGTLEDSLNRHLDDLRGFLAADGVLVMRGDHIITEGTCPPKADARRLAEWLIGRSTERVFATDRLGQLYPAAEPFQDVAAGVLSVTLSAEDRWLLVWFRAEEVTLVNWAGNPHKATEVKLGEVLSPRASFENWQETVRGRSRRWTPSEAEAAERIRRALIDVRQNRRINDLNRQLLDSLGEKDMLLKQKEFLIGEVNHRVQNSLQLVSSFLSLQARNSKVMGFAEAVEEARRRISAVSLVHRRLYRGDSVGMIDVARYIEELCADLRASMGSEWGSHFAFDLAPIMMPTDRAVTLGLILTELIININKYAYGGAPGPIGIVLTEDRTKFRLIVADQGQGKKADREGFGSRMMAALVQQLSGDLMFEDNNPGLRATLTAPAGGQIATG